MNFELQVESAPDTAQIARSVTADAPPLDAADRYLRRLRRSVLPLLGLLPVVGILALGLGSVQVSPMTIIYLLVSRLPMIEVPVIWSTGEETIVLQLRMPRILLAGLSGAALAMAGATYQGLFRNPLGDPYLLGVAPGASLGATVVIAFGVNVSLIGLGATPVAAFFGALGATIVIYLLARVDKTTPVTTLILAGVAMGSLLSSITSAVLFARPERVRHAVFWMFGSFATASWPRLWVTLPYLIVGAAIVLLHARTLNVLLLDEEQAQQLGVEVERTKIILIVAATLLTAATVAVSGLIGFVGLVAPHTARLIWGPDYRVLLPTSALVGGIFLVLADLFARTVVAPSELPVGIISALCGAPFFLYLLRQRKKAVF